MRSYRIVEKVYSLRGPQEKYGYQERTYENYVLHLYEAGIEEVSIVFESDLRAYDFAMKYVAGETFMSRS